MAAFLCKKCAHKTLPISITTFHFQFAVLPFCRFHANPPLPHHAHSWTKKSEKHSLGSWALREGLEKCELRTENWALKIENLAPVCVVLLLVALPLPAAVARPHEHCAHSGELRFAAWLFPSYYILLLLFFIYTFFARHHNARLVKGNS